MHAPARGRRTACRGAAGRRPGRCGLSQQAGQGHRHRSGRRRRRHRHAPRYRATAHRARPAVRHREPWRRRRQHRGRSGVQRRPRRLHANGLAARATHDQCRALQEAQLRPDPVRTGRADVVGAERAAGPQRLPRQDRPGVHRLCEGQPGQAQLRLAGTRHDLASHGRTVQQARRRQAPARALQGNRAGAERSRRRPRGPDLHAARSGDQTARERQGPHPCGHDREAHLDAARRADHGRGRTEGLHLRHLERDRSPSEDAGARHRQAQHCGQRGAEAARNAGAVPQAQPAGRRRHAAGPRQNHAE